MSMKRLAGLGLSLALGAGALSAAPVMNAAPAQASVVVSPVVSASKPKIKTNLPVRKLVTVGKTTTLKVKATGSSLKYQWYYAGYTDFFWQPVKGKAGKRSYLKVKATLAKSGGQYRVVVTNSKGKKTSRATTLLVRPTVANSFAPYKAGYTAHWRFSPITSSMDQFNGTTVLKLLVSPRNLTSKARNPKGNVSIAFRAKNGKVYYDRNANGKFFATVQYWDNPGVNAAGTAKAGQWTNSIWAGVVVPTSLATGGRWIIRDSASPAMTLYFKQ